MSFCSKLQACKDIALNRLIKNKDPFRVMSIDDTINYIIENDLSVSRYGDGEALMMANQMNESFQTYDREFAKKLMCVAKNPIEKHLTCIPDIFIDLSKYTDDAQAWFNGFLKRKKYLYYRYFDYQKVYGNAFITRPYMDLKDKGNSPHYYEMLKNIWCERDLLIVEGEFSRLGVGNDLFDGANSIARILCPAVNAYRHYSEILPAIEKNANNKLVLIALGATATVLAYDLAKDGYRAIDIGHVDIEYEWMLMGATSKVPIKSKYVNEAKDGHCQDNIVDEKYNREIVCKIGI